MATAKDFKSGIKTVIMDQLSKATNTLITNDVRRATAANGAFIYIAIKPNSNQPYIEVMTRNDASKSFNITQEEYTLYIQAFESRRRILDQQQKLNNAREFHDFMRDVFSAKNKRTATI